MSKLIEAVRATVYAWENLDLLDKGTSAELEMALECLRDELIDMSINDMWERLTQHQPYADDRGYGPEWAKMCAERTADAAWAAAGANAHPCGAPAAKAARSAANAAWVGSDAAAAEVAEAVKWIEKSEGRE